MANGRQLYKCHACGKQFLGGERRDPRAIFAEYLEGKQTYEQLAEKYGCSTRTIQRCLDKVRPSRSDEFSPVANVVMDTTYFGRKFGVMVFKNSLDGVVLLKKYVRNETVEGYVSGIAEIARRGISVQAIVCDGRKGVIQAFPDIPVQSCQFHQVKTVTKYLTRKPKLVAAKELRAISLKLVGSTEAEFVGMLDAWQKKWGKVLKERSTNEETGKTFYTHKPLRSAYRSLRNNLPHLFVFERWRELGIPNTTNALDGQFSDLKNKLRNHNGLSTTRKTKLIDEYFSA